VYQTVDAVNTCIFYKDNVDMTDGLGVTSVSVYRLYYVEAPAASSVRHKKILGDFSFNALDTIRKFRFKKFLWRHTREEM